MHSAKKKSQLPVKTEYRFCKLIGHTYQLGPLTAFSLWLLYLEFLGCFTTIN